MRSELGYKLVDSFLFSEAYESELLLIKFNLEDKGIAEWIMLENDYTLQGAHKGYNALTALKDPRFDRFRHKIKVLQCSIKGKEVYDKIENNDGFAFKVETQQREIVRDYFLDNYSDGDYLIVSDTDEAIDFENENRAKEVTLAIRRNQTDVVNLRLRRYWYDIDNAYLVDYAQTLIPYTKIRSSSLSLAAIRNENKSGSKLHTNNIVAFEYSHVFKIKHIQRKWRTFSHTGYDQQDLDIAFMCNQRPVSANYKGTLKNSRRYFFEKIEIHARNSPTYVLQNQKLLRTGHIDKNYKNNRMIMYPELFSPKQKFIRRIRELRDLLHKYF